MLPVALQILNHSYRLTFFIENQDENHGGGHHNFENVVRKNTPLVISGKNALLEIRTDLIIFLYM